MDTAQKRAETQADLGPVIPHPRNGEAAVRRNGNADATVGSHGLESDAFIRRDLELPRYSRGLSECADCCQKPDEDQIESRIHGSLSGGSESDYTRACLTRACGRKHIRPCRVRQPACQRPNVEYRALSRR